jgi:hypothetical protein
MSICNVSWKSYRLYMRMFCYLSNEPSPSVPHQVDLAVPHVWVGIYSHHAWGLFEEHCQLLCLVVWTKGSWVSVWTISSCNCDKCAKVEMLKNKVNCYGVCRVYVSTFFSLALMLFRCALFSFLFFRHMKIASIMCMISLPICQLLPPAQINRHNHILCLLHVYF